MLEQDEIYAPQSKPYVLLRYDFLSNLSFENASLPDYNLFDADLLNQKHIPLTRSLEQRPKSVSSSMQDLNDFDRDTTLSPDRKSGINTEKESPVHNPEESKIEQDIEQDDVH